MAYFDPLQDWPKPIEQNMTIPILLEDLVFLGDTRSRYELLVFAQANPARLPLAMGLAQPDIPARRMANDRKVQLTDALVRILVRFLTPVTVETELVHDSYYREYLLPWPPMVMVMLVLGGPPFRSPNSMSFPTPKTGMEQIEQFSDIILRILRFLAESSGVIKLELFQSFPHCK